MGGQKVKRRESSVCPGRHVSPLATKVGLQFPDCHQHKPDNPLVHFCSSAFKYVVIPNILTDVHARTKLTPWQLCWVCFPWKLSKVCRWRGKNEREKTDSRTKQQAGGNRISSALHPTRSQSRLTTARAKDAQARAKLFSSKRRPPIVRVTVRLTVRLTHGRCGLLFQQKPKEKQDVCTTSFLFSKRWHKNLILADCWSFFKDLYVVVYSLSTWKISTGLRLSICPFAGSSDGCGWALELPSARVWSSSATNNSFQISFQTSGATRVCMFH